MHCYRSLAVSCVLVVTAACGEQPQGPDTELEPSDTLQTRGTLLVTGESISSLSGIVWVPGTDLVAYTWWSPTGEGCAIKTVDAVTGATRLVDDDCTSFYVETQAYLRRLVTAPDGSALYYVVSTSDTLGSPWVLRMADLNGGDTSTLRDSVRATALAVSPDGRRLAYTASSLLVRDVSSGAETEHPVNAGDPIVFSPDGTELLYEFMDAISPWSVQHRWSIESGADEVISLPTDYRPRTFRWGASGIEVLAEVLLDYPTQYHVLNLASGRSVQVSFIESGEDVPYEQLVWGHETWSADGTRVAYWTGSCLAWAGLFDCSVERYSLFVADTDTGDWTRAVYTENRNGPVALAPDGARLVYYSSPGGVDGSFYVVEVG